MKHRIDPTVDCVFKALLGTHKNLNLLINFINAVLGSALESPITHVTLLNPYNEREFVSDKLSIVDVKASDDEGRLYQIEVQLEVFKSLPSRMLYTWSDIYSKQIQSGDNFNELKATYSIWLLNKQLTTDERYIRQYTMQDQDGQVLCQHGGIWVLELGKFATAQTINDDKDRWLAFFKDGDQLDDQSLPAWMDTQEMRQAMHTLRQFSEKEREYDRYQARQNFLRQQSAINEEREEALAALAETKRKAAQLEEETQRVRQEALAERSEKEAAQQKAQESEQKTQAALAEIARLKALLAQNND